MLKPPIRFSDYSFFVSLLAEEKAMNNNASSSDTGKVRGYRNNVTRLQFHFLLVFYLVLHDALHDHEDFRTIWMAVQRIFTPGPDEAPSDCHILGVAKCRVGVPR
jgi:hypothetical protein